MKHTVNSIFLGCSPSREMMSVCMQSQKKIRQKTSHLSKEPSNAPWGKTSPNMGTIANRLGKKGCMGMRPPTPVVMQIVASSL